MINYIPFLKFKQNEIQGLGELKVDVFEKIRPFFDVSRDSENHVERDILKRLELGEKHLDKLVEDRGNFGFYIDNFDLNDSILLHNTHQYEYILSRFAKYRAIPVVAFDRDSNHNLAVFGYLKNVGGRVALRLQLEDLESFAVTEKKLITLWPKLIEAGAQAIHLIIDLRVISDPQIIAQTIIAFLLKFKIKFPTEAIIVTGSTIPAIIGELVGTGQTIDVLRNEYLVWTTIIGSPNLKKVAFGDYGVVSPNYADVDLDPKLFRKISAPKAFYPYLNMMLAIRGSSFGNHPAGNGQYYDLADLIEQKSFYRGELFSYGDKYIYMRSNNSPKKPAKAGSPGSWVKATLVSHITFISGQV